MPYTIDDYGQACVLVINGRFLGSIEREAMQQTFDALIAEGRARLVIDLSKTDFMDSTGIGVLIQGIERLREAGGEACLAGMQTRVKSLFVMTRLLGRMFDDYPTVEAALEHFAAPVASKQE